MTTTRIPQRYQPDTPITALHEHPENARLGDVDAIGESLDINGWYGAVLAQESTGNIVVGNHRYRTAVERGDQTLPTLWLDIDDDAARRILAVDQRLAQKGGVHPGLLTRLLRQLAVTPEGLAGSGYTDRELEGLGVLMDDNAWDDLAAGSRNPDPRPDPEPLPGLGPAATAPRIVMTVPPDMFEAWRRLLDRYTGRDDLAKLTAHLHGKGCLK